MNSEIPGFNELYQKHKDMVYRLCYLYLKNRSDAEDAVQSVFLKYISSKATYENPSHEKAWFITTSKNYCMNALKNWWKSRRIAIEDLPEIPTCDTHVERGVVFEKLLSLPAKYKTVLYLYYYEGYSINEISVILGRKTSTIQTQLSRGRERLKISLGGYYE